MARKVRVFRKKRITARHPSAPPVVPGSLFALLATWKPEPFPEIEDRPAEPVEL